jgi:hypothetical protein
MSEEHAGMPLDFGGEAAEVERLAEALDAIERGEDPQIDPREDPMLAGMIETVALVDETLTAAVQTERFEAFAAHSRTTIARAAGRYAAAEQRALATSDTSLEERPERALGEPRALVEAPGGFFGFLRRPWVVVTTPAIAAAAAAIATFLVVSGGSTQTTLVVPPITTAATQIGLGEVAVPSTIEPVEVAPPSVESFVGTLTDEDLATAVNRISTSVEVIRFRVENGEPLDAGMLRDLTEAAKFVAREIEFAPPEAYPKDAVLDYMLDTDEARRILGEATVEEGQEDALVAAQRAVNEGVYAASLFIIRTESN